MKPHYEVVAAVIERQGRILCVQRGKTRYEYTSYRYEFPGGKIEDGETPEEALRRELIEEMNYEVDILRMLGEVTHEYADFTVHLRFYHCHPKSDAPRLQEHIDRTWMRPSGLTCLPWVDADREFVLQLPGLLEIG